MNEIQPTELKTIAEFETRWGRILALRNDNPISESLEKYGEWAQIEIEFLCQFIRDDSVILDAGSHIGIHSLAFAHSAAKNVHVHAFEAQPQLSALSMRNAKVSGSRISVQRCAIGESEGAGFIPRLPDDRPVNAGAQNLEYQAGPDRLETPIRTIDSFGLSGVTLIKLDIEGCEAAALRGAVRTVSNDKPVIYCEVNSIAAAADLLQIMEGRGYTYYFVSTPAFNPENFRSASANFFGVAHESALLLLPVGHETPEIRRVSICAPVTGLDDFAPLFLRVPRYGDESDQDIDYVKLKAELDALRENMHLDRARAAERDRELAVSRAEANSLRERLRADQVEMARRDHGLAQAQAEIDALKGTLRESRTELERRDQMLALAQAKIDTLKGAVRESRAELALRRDMLAATKAEVAVLSEMQREDRVEAARREQSLVQAKAEIHALSEEMRIERQRYHVLAKFLWKRDPAARRRSIVGPIARRFGRSELARACRTLTRSGLFDRQWYKRAYGDVAASNQEPVVHYLLFGAFEGRKPNRVFDSSYYLTENSDVRLSGINPLLHYIRWGEREMRRPSPDFDPASYLEAHPSLKGSDIPFLKHFLDHGSLDTPVTPPYRPVAPDWSAFEALVASRGKDPDQIQALVDVIVPVYRGYDDTLSCIFSVLTSGNATPFELIVIDDESPEPALSEALNRLADMGLITLLRNERNLGFVGTVNRGMALHKTRDVLLLNSDTIVFNDWLDRIRAHGLARDVATITPFTNSGTICSYPEFCRDNRSELEVSFSELDLMAAGLNRQQAIEVPTGVGFCMYITRKALNDIGLFDVETFGKGYGEENDFCVRAFERGLRNLHALDVFVFHSGETSFGADASKAKKAGLAAVVARHPGYIADVEKYVAADPAKEARVRLDVGRLLKRAPERIILCFTHVMGGGIVRYLKDRAESGREAGEVLLLAVPASPDGRTIRLTGIDGRPMLPNLRDFDMERDGEDLTRLLRSLPVSAMEVHSTVGWSAGALQFIPGLARALGIAFDFIAHDYVSVCPQINLINESGIYCGEEGDEQCKRCLRALTKEPRIIHSDMEEAGMGDIVGWRDRYELFMEQAREVTAPSSDTAARLMKYFPGIHVVSRPHNEVIDTYARCVAEPYLGGVLKVAIIGAIGPHKGAKVLQECADDAARRGLPIHFVVVGYTSIPELASKANVTVTGAYAEHEVFDRLAEVGAHVAFLPSIWPETYCYALSIAIAGGLSVCAFDLGAQAERLRAIEGGILLPTEMMTAPDAINDMMLKLFSSSNLKNVDQSMSCE